MNLSPAVQNELLKERKALSEQLANMETIKSKIEAIDLLLNGSQSIIMVEAKSPTPGNQYSTEYDKEWVWEDKCLFVLKKLGKAYTFQIADEILKYEPHLKDGDKEEKKARDKTNYNMSILYRNNRVNKVGQTGKKYLFAPKE